MPTQYQIAKTARDVIETNYNKACDAMKQFPKLPNGLIPDEVRATDAYRVAKRDLDRTFSLLREYNAHFCKQFPKEIRAERDARRVKVGAK